MVAVQLKAGKSEEVKLFHDSAMMMNLLIAGATNISNTFGYGKIKKVLLELF